MRTLETLSLPSGFAEIGTPINLENQNVLFVENNTDSYGITMLGETTVQFLDTFPPHSHTHSDETFFVLDGCFDITVDGETVSAGTGDCVFVPSDTLHSWCCTSLEGGRLLVLVAPAEDRSQFQTDACRPTKHFGFGAAEPIFAPNDPLRWADIF